LKPLCYLYICEVGICLAGLEAFFMGLAVLLFSPLKIKYSLFLEGATGLYVNRFIYMVVL